MSTATVMRMTIFNLHVCVPKDWTNAQVKEWADRECYAGTQHGWSVREGADERIACADDKERVHIMMVC